MARPKPAQDAPTAQTAAVTAHGSVTPAVVAPGTTATISLSVTSTVTLTALVYVEVRTAGGATVYAQELRNQVLTAGQPTSLTAALAVPSAVLPGPYSVAVLARHPSR